MSSFAEQAHKANVHAAFLNLLQRKTQISENRFARLYSRALDAWAF
jgi:hypothetical protein